MAEITAALVKELRELSGAGMMDCKKALAETGGDLQAASDWLRKKGLASAAKKAGRVAAEGLVGLAAADGKAALVEVNAETDFVARNEIFQDFVRTVAGLALAHDDIEALRAAPYPGGGGSVADKLTQLIATIGENMTLRRMAKLAVEPGVVASYLHNAAGPGLGKIGVLVALESTGDRDKLAALGKNLAMHIAAANPLALTTADIDPAAVERERAIYAAKARESGKKEEIIAKIVESSVRSFYSQVVLMEQEYQGPPAGEGVATVSALIAAGAKAAGAPVKVKGFVRMALGEGIAKEKKDFAAEVAGQLG
ncbi:MAG: elongation factor Ts [Rhodospirillaceae bacterium]|nr:elongation factor Ts [Rhodospirillaceae bacterium]